MIEDILLPYISGRFREEPHYRLGHIRIVNPLPGTAILGLHIPDMKKIAKELSARDDRMEILHGLETASIEGSSKGGISRLAQMRKPQCTVVHEDFRIKRNAESTLLSCPHALYYEETVIWGLMLDNMKIPLDERLGLFGKFIPNIDNWAVCDTVCCAAKWAGHKGTDKNRLWDFLGNLRDSDREFEVRFATIMTMCYFLEPKWLPGVFKETDRIDFGRIRSKYIPIAEKKSLQSNRYAKAAEPKTVPCGYGYCLSGSRTGTVPGQSPYYVRMGVAWLLATALAKFPEQTREYVRTCNLPDDVVRLYVRKAKESFRTRDTDPL